MFSEQTKSTGVIDIDGVCIHVALPVTGFCLVHAASLIWFTSTRECSRDIVN